MRMSISRRVGGCLLSLLLCAASAQAAEKPWDQVLKPQEPKLPAPRSALDVSMELPTHRKEMAKTTIKWETDLQDALKIAQKENRPIFLTFRCLPCKSCSQFDKTVLEGGPDLNPLFQQFVTVRLINTKDVDQRILPMAMFQDLDVSWWSWFLSPEGKVYGVFGGRDASGDEGRTSKASLIKTMNRVLAHHYDSRRAQWDVDGAAPILDGKPVTPIDMPGFGNWLKHRRNAEIYKTQNCIHCHQASEIFRQTEIDAGKFVKQRDVHVWPFPENTGLNLDRDDGLLVKDVKSGSAAAKAGIKPGDTLGAAGDRALFSQADFRGVLHRAPVAGPVKIDVRWLRNGQVMAGTLDLPEGWRASDLGWRASLAEGNVGAFAGFWPQLVAEPVRAKLGIPADKLAIKPFIGGQKSPAVAAGLKGDDTIVAVNGESPNISNRAFTVWFRMKFEPGQEVTLTVKDPSGKEREIKFKPEN
jgi:membrane-associated protease RseP (regulator of RpoE activity)